MARVEKLGSGFVLFCFLSTQIMIWHEIKGLKKSLRSMVNHFSDKSYQYMSYFQKNHLLRYF